MNRKRCDIHSHLNFSDFENDLDEVIKRMREEEIGTIVVGSNLKDSEKAIEIAEKYENVFASVGIHPDELGNPESLGHLVSKLKELAKNKKVVAIGECGLDLKNQNANIKNQKKLFIEQIELAKELNKPLMIHCREAHDEVLEILKNYRHYGNIHFFSGDRETAKKYFELGFFISFTGVITFARDYDEVIKNAPLEKIMIETDAPFVSPVPFRGKRNEPAYVIEVAKKIAEIKNLSLEEVASATTKNAVTLFSLSPAFL